MKYAIGFDMDETLGFFQQINYLWHLILKLNNKINENLFKYLLNLYPEFIRPNILEILTYLKIKKLENKCSNIIIYTNNKTSKEWVTLIQNYFNEMINFDLFDRIICAFKINNIIIEKNRTTNNKTFEDLIKCSFLDSKSKICYIDDKYYPDLNKNNLIYIKVKEYYHEISKDILFKRLKESFLVKKNIISKNLLLNIFNNYKYTNKFNKENTEIHKIVSKKIMFHLVKFFSNNKTLKKKNIFNKTKKNF